MKKLISIPALSVIMILSLQAQPVSDYLYKLDNGITIRKDKSWSQVWIQQSHVPLAANDQNQVAVNVRPLGDLISSQAFTLLSNGKEVKTKGIAPGTYDLKMSFKLSGTPGTISFVVGNVVIKPKTKTNVSVTLYDYQIGVNETASTGTGPASFETSVQRCRLTPVDGTLTAIPEFFTWGNRQAAITPEEGAGKVKGRIRSGKYDVLLNVNLAGQKHKVWLENFEMKPGVAYKISANLNAGGVIYTGTNRSVKGMHMYPAGTAAQQGGTAAPVKTQAALVYTNISELNCCTPGTFDVLLQMQGDKYEWRKNVAVTTGTKTEIK